MKNKETKLIGRKLTRIAAREFYLDGIISSPCCPLFIEDENQECWQLYYDDETYEWKLHPKIQNFPEIGTIRGDSKMQWKDVEVANAPLFEGKAITAFATKSGEKSCSAKLFLENGWVIFTTYDFETETQQFQVTQTNHLDKFLPSQG